jgi:hypothetical protein
MNGLFGPAHLIAAVIVIAVLFGGLRLLRSFVRFVLKP